MKYKKSETFQSKVEFDDIILGFYQTQYPNTWLSNIRTSSMQSGALTEGDEKKIQILVQLLNDMINCGIWAERNNLIYKKKQLEDEKAKERSYI